jgi:hypothetical protein
MLAQRAEARTEDRGEDIDEIEEESRMISHEPWRVSTKNGLDSRKTADVYTQEEHHLPRSFLFNTDFRELLTVTKI